MNLMSVIDYYNLQKYCEIGNTYVIIIIAKQLNQLIRYDIELYINKKNMK